MPLPTRNQTGEHAPSFIGEMQPSVVWAQSAAYLPVSAKLNNMQRKLECKNCHCICHSTSAGASKKAGSQEIPTAELFRTCQDVIALNDLQCVAVHKVDVSSASQTSTTHPQSGQAAESPFSSTKERTMLAGFCCSRAPHCPTQ